MAVKKIKIAHLSSAHPDGDVRIFHKECISLANNFHPSDFEVEVHLVLSGVEERTERNVHIHSVPHHGGRRLNRMWTTVNDVYKKAVELDADIYHFHDPELLRIALKLQRKGKRVIYDVHEDVPKQIMDKYWIPSLIRGLVSGIFRSYEHYAAKRMSAIVSVTEIICARFSKVNKRVEMVANYPILEEMEWMNTVEAQKVSNQICYVGGLFPTRGVKELVEALEHSNATLLLAGTFSPASFQQEVMSLPGWKKVRYLGHVGRKEIATIVKSSNLGIVTLHPTGSYMESLPIKMFEYMSAGIPVLASDFPLWRKIIDESKCGVYANPLDPIEIAEKIDFLLTNSKIANEMGKNGLEAVLSRFNWRAEEAKLFTLYSTIISKI